jgi:hypothetical protein
MVKKEQPSANSQIPNPLLSPFYIKGIEGEFFVVAVRFTEHETCRFFSSAGVPAIIDIYGRIRSCHLWKK